MLHKLAKLYYQLSLLPKLICKRFLFLIRDLLHARLNCHYEQWGHYKKKKYKKVTPYRKSVWKEPTLKRC